MPLPLTPRNQSDPTGTGYLRKRGLAEADRRMKVAARGIRQIVQNWPYAASTVPDDEAPTVRKSEKRTASLKANATVYEYQSDQFFVDQQFRRINAMLTQALLDGSDEWSNRWWLWQYWQPANDGGIEAALIDAQRISEGLVSAVAQAQIDTLTAEAMIQTPAMQSRIANIGGRVFESMRNITSDAISDMRNTLTDGMARGLGVRDLSGMVNKAAGVSLSRAKTIVRTEITRAHKTAYWDSMDQINKETFKGEDWQIRYMHISALSSTTRASHAIRHGKVYTKAQEQNWYASPASQGGYINCMCSVTAVMQELSTGKIDPAMSGFVSRTRERGEQYFKANGVL